MVKYHPDCGASRGDAQQLGSPKARSVGDPVLLNLRFRRITALTESSGTPNTPRRQSVLVRLSLVKASSMAGSRVSAAMIRSSIGVFTDFNHVAASRRRSLAFLPSAFGSMGMFWRFGFCEFEAPVDVAVAEGGMTRPVFGQFAAGMRRRRWFQLGHSPIFEQPARSRFGRVFSQSPLVVEYLAVLVFRGSRNLHRLDRNSPSYATN